MVGTSCGMRQRGKFRSRCSCSVMQNCKPNLPHPTTTAEMQTHQYAVNGNAAAGEERIGSKVVCSQWRGGISPVPGKQ